MMHCKNVESIPGCHRADASVQLPITDSMLRRVTGASHGSQSFESYLLSGKIKDGQWSKMMP